MRLGIDRIDIDNSECLGPGRRVEIWFHGCNRSCLGCITTDNNYRKEPIMDLSVSAVFDFVLKHEGVEGVTISGGEPILQIHGLIELVRKLKNHGLGIILYSGYLHDEIEEIEFGVELLHSIDVLIDGTYIRELDDGKPFRGSSNQNIIQMTDRYKAFYMRSNTKRECRVQQNGLYFTLTGIPDMDSKNIWKIIKKKGDF